MDLDLLPDPVFLLDPDLRLIGWNDAATEVLGALDDVKGLPFGEALDITGVTGAPIYRDGLPDGADETEVNASGRQGPEVALRLRHRVDAEGKTVVTARPVGDKSGIAIVSTVSHELRSPLTSVKGYVSLMLNRWDRIDDAKKREMLEQVHHDADRVTRLVTELLDISRLESGRLVLRRQMVDVAALATSVVEKVGMGYPTLDCAVDLPTLPEVYADSDKLEQVLTNLVENAAKYGDPVGMRLTGAVDDDAVTVTVTDQGEGIPTAEIEKVFTKFFRRDHGKPSGTGLGLWISRGLVEAHGGSLTATSAEGAGCAFTFTLPLDAFEKAHGTPA